MKKTAFVLVPAALALALAFPSVGLRGLSQTATPPPPKRPPAKVTSGKGAKGVPLAEDPWKDVERLISEQKMEEASQRVSRIRSRARAANDEAEWTRALIREVQLRTALHGYETAVRFLKDEPWPKGLLHRAALNLFYAQSLVDYQRAYSWEIGQRERVDTKGVVDLKAWTKDQIAAAAARAYRDVYADRETLGRESVERLSDYLDANNYPKDVRGTLRDAVSYLFVELLSDTSLWRPEHESGLFALDLPALLAGDPAVSKNVRLDDPETHPILRASAILDDLSAWHASRGEKGAVLEAHLALLRSLHASFTQAEDRALIRADLAKRLPSFRDVPWWAMGKADLATFIQDEAKPDSLVKARAVAEEGRAAYPDSPGGQKCLSIVKSIEAPGYELAAMSNDAARKRSIEVSHKNLEAVFFRAYRIDLQKRVESARDYNLLPSGHELEQLLDGGRPDAEWSVSLPATPDFRMHRTYVTPPLDARGAYAVMASARKDFSGTSNKVMSAGLLVSGLVLVTRQETDGVWEVAALSGEAGTPVAEAAVSLYQFDWQKGHQRLETKTTGKDGLVRFEFREDRSGRPHFLLAKKGEDLALDTAGLSFYRMPPPSESSAALVYTDRSIYRPLQKLFWKVVAYTGRADQGRFRVLPQTPITVTLRDGNNQEVVTRQVTTNAYGSAAGEIELPAGRVLGAWQIGTSLGGSASIQVEEYKRPTFEAALKESKEALRLNRPARLAGEVKYYFGLPVTSGSVRWRATRELVYPWWWGWWWGVAAQQPEVVASGSSSLQPDGSFEVAFTPKADERKKREKGISYRYRVTADVTDEGGETRSASRSFRLGFVSVEATFDSDTAFFREGTGAEVRVTRTDLDGTPRSGKGIWRLTRLVQPAKAVLPADEPVTRAPGEEPGFETPGDLMRPRWAQADPYERTLHSWKEGAEAGRGELLHDAKGVAKAPLGSLAAGAYRLRYETKDDFGSPFDVTKDFLVAGKSTPVALPALLLAESSSVPVGGTARLLVVSGLPGQALTLDIYRGGKLSERRALVAGRDASLVEIPVGPEDRGGFGVTLLAVRDHQLLQQTQAVFVPWDDRELKISFATFRDKLRPGGTETWRVNVKSASGSPVEAGAAELLAYMYDKSLDVFAPHSPPSTLGLYPYRAMAAPRRATLGPAQVQWVRSSGFPSIPGPPSLVGDRLKFESGYGIGGPGGRFRVMRGGVAGGPMRQMAVPASAPALMAQSEVAAETKVAALGYLAKNEAAKRKDVAADKLTERDERAKALAPVEAPVALRSDFSETAFWKPQLLTGPDGSASIEFTVPDSVTAWNVYVHAVTKDLRGGSLQKEARSVKDLMVRPYLPRFLREGDEAQIKVVVNNASEKELKGRVTFEILDPATNQSLLSDFGLKAPATAPFVVKAGGGADLTFPLRAPKRVGSVAFKVTAVSGDTSDGELRPLPLLPSRMHLTQSRFVTLKNKDKRTLRFDDLAKDDDPSRVQEQMVVTVDAQLFYTVLQALPYLVNYPYECTEQTLNRFVSTGIVSSLYASYPAIAKMAQSLSKRTTQLESWDAADPNRKMALEETPWLEMAKGGIDKPDQLTNVLDPRIARADRDAALAKLRKAQTSLGAFPWWPGGPPSPFMTLYILHGFAKAAEFGVDVPKDMVQHAWAYLASHYRDDLKKMMAEDCCWEFLTFLNYVASCYPDSSWTGDALTAADRKEILAFSFKHWKQHSPYLKGYLSLTLKRMGRPGDAELVWDSVMDSAKTTEDQGTFWAPEDRSWLWYNDTTETHAFALRTLMELRPEDGKREGLVQWLLLDKKLNHWKSTRATAEVVYSLVHYLKKEGALGIREDATVVVGPQTVTFTFEPDVYTGKKNQVVVPGEKVDPKTMSSVVVSKESKGFAFASATWSFSTDRLPTEERGDFFNVSRAYFLRETKGREAVLTPLAEGAALKPGDEVEVHVSLRSKHAAEYVHLRDPRAAGLEPENAVSRYKWDLGIAWYEETRDSGTNFFFEQLPVGEYTFKYRLRASMAGTFRVGPATVQSMYAPEFHAYSAGNVLRVEGKGK